VLKRLQELVKKNFTHFSYFYGYLRNKFIISLFFSLLVGTLDGLGLALFLPLLQMVDGQSSADAESLGNLRFLVDWMDALSIPMTIASVLLVMLFFFVLKAFAKFGEAYYKILLSRFFMRSLRFDQIDRLNEYSYKAFVTSDIGRIQGSLSSEVARILNAYKSYFSSIQAGVMVLVYVILAFMANPEFAFFVIAGGMLTNILYRRVYKKTIEGSKKITGIGHRFQGYLIQQVQFFKYLKATGHVNTYSDKLKQSVLQGEAITKQMGWYGAIVTSFKEPLVVAVVVCVIILQVNVFNESLGLIILSLLFFYRSLSFMMNLQNQWNGFLTSSGALTNMQEFMADLRANAEKRTGSDFTGFNDKIEVDNLCFSYDDRPTLKGINLAIGRNETVAFVGKSGSGKTSLINLLTGLLTPDKGEIRVDGVPLSKIKTDTYQRRIGYITQDPVIFSDSVFNNVTLWAEKTPENLDNFWKALDRASIKSFVETLGGREDSMLGANGVLVSGGQKQRISIARELYKSIDILIMDEATSSLDSETERTIQMNIDMLKGRYTILIIAHRLATIRNADRVVLLNNGCIDSVGTFEHLKTASKAFEKMVELQEV